MQWYPDAPGASDRFSGQGMRVREISSQLGMSEEYLRELIRNFNGAGFSALKQRRRYGRPPRLSEEERSLIVEIATAPPQAFGRPFNQWSLRKLQEFLVTRKLVSPVSYTTIRRVLKQSKVSFQRTRTWKRSKDPHYDAKKTRPSPLRKGTEEIVSSLFRRVWTHSGKAATGKGVGSLEHPY